MSGRHARRLLRERRRDEAAEQRVQRYLYGRSRRNVVRLPPARPFLRIGEVHRHDSATLDQLRRDVAAAYEVPGRMLITTTAQVHEDCS